MPYIEEHQSGIIVIVSIFTQIFYFSSILYTINYIWYLYTELRMKHNQSGQSTPPLVSLTQSGWTLRDFHVLKKQCKYSEVSGVLFLRFSFLFLTEVLTLLIKKTCEASDCSVKKRHQIGELRVL